MDLVVEMVEHHVWVVDQLVDRAAGLTEETYDPFDGLVEGIDGEWCAGPCPG